MLEEKIPLRNYAHIGDAVWDVFVREYAIFQTSNAKVLHKMTTDRVNAVFQKDLLHMIENKLTADETELARRARNLPIPTGRRSIQKDYRQSTAFEVLIGYWYLHDKQRLDYFLSEFKDTEFFN